MRFIIEYVLVVWCKQTCPSTEFVEWKSKGELGELFASQLILIGMFILLVALSLKSPTRGVSIKYCIVLELVSVTKLNLQTSSEVFIETRSPAASLPLKGQVTHEQTTVKIVY